MSRLVGFRSHENTLVECPEIFYHYSVYKSQKNKTMTSLQTDRDEPAV